MRNQIEYTVYGDYALFTDPFTKLGGEKMTMHIPTYEALKGITSSIYWKPSIIWIIDEVRVMNPIQMESKGMRPMKMDGKNDLAYYSYLKDVKYQVRAHFEFNHRRPDLQSDFNEHKHHNIAKRAVQKGGRRDIFLGTRECQAYVEYEEFGSGEGAYDHIDELHYGVMVHGIDYPDESGKEQLMTRLWTPVMKNGVITFICPDQCTMRRELSTYEAKSFTIGRNMKSVDDTYAELVGE